MVDKLCKFDRAWIGTCNIPVIDGSDFCIEHTNMKCGVCKNQATRECSYSGQFVCGYPLCDNCEGYEKRDKPSGNWGFLNHYHRRRLEL